MPKRTTTSSTRKSPSPQPAPLPSPQVLDPLPHNTAPIIRHGREAVVYHIPISSPLPSSSSAAPPSSAIPSTPKTTILLPRHSTWTSGLHFHTTHTEHLRLLRGAIFISLNGTTTILSAAAASPSAPYTITIPKHAPHNWGRAAEYLSTHPTPPPQTHAYPDDVDEDVVVEEWTDPADISKPLFFWNLNGIVLASSSTPLPVLQRGVRKGLGGEKWVELQLCSLFWELDSWPVVCGLRGVGGGGGGGIGWWVEWLVSVCVVVLMKIVGWGIGVVAVTKERTPVGLWEEYARKGV